MFNRDQNCQQKSYFLDMKILTSKIGIFRSFSMKFFFSSKQEYMTNTIQSVFLSVTHVFVPILKLLKKIWLSKMYPYFKLLIFGYISRFLTKFSTPSKFEYWHENMSYAQKDWLDRIRHTFLLTTEKNFIENERKMPN